MYKACMLDYYALACKQHLRLHRICPCDPIYRLTHLQNVSLIFMMCVHILQDSRISKTLLAFRHWIRSLQHLIDRCLSIQHKLNKTIKQILHLLSMLLYIYYSHAYKKYIFYRAACIIYRLNRCLLTRVQAAYMCAYIRPYYLTPFLSDLRFEFEL